MRCCCCCIFSIFGEIQRSRLQCGFAQYHVCQLCHKHLVFRPATCIFLPFWIQFTLQKYEILQKPKQVIRATILDQQLVLLSIQVIATAHSLLTSDLFSLLLLLLFNLRSLNCLESLLSFNSFEPN